MMNRKYITLTIFLILFLMITVREILASGYGVNYDYKPITVKDGLSHSTVTSILKDHQGRLWIGTNSGLNLFEQHELTIFLHELDNTKSLPSNHILFIAEDQQHNIWVSTTKGLVRYNTTSGTFISCLPNKVYDYLNIQDGILFSGDNALYSFSNDKEGYEVIMVDPEIEKPAADQYKIFRLFDMGEGKILLSMKNDGFFQLDLTTGHIKLLDFGQELTMTASHIDQAGNIWCSFFNRGVFCFDMYGNLRTHYTTQNSNLSNNTILDFWEKNDRLWLATDGGGISILDKDDEVFHVLKHVPGDPNSLPVSSINLLYGDLDDNLWAGTVRGGFFQIKETFIEVFQDVALNNRNGLSERAVISLFEDGDSVLWIGTDGGGINSYNPFTEKFTHYLETYGDKVVSITDLSDEELLISLYSKGVFAFNKATRRFRPFIIVNDSVHQEECFGGFMPLLHRIGDNEILILAKHAFVYHPSEKQFVSIGTRGDPANLGALFLQYADADCVFLSKDNRVYTLDRQAYELSELISLHSGETIHSICYDEKNTLWIGSDRGLYYYDIEKEKLSYIETKMFNEITYLFLDDQSRLWISAQNRLFSYIIPQERFVIWGESEGFVPNEILSKYQNHSSTDNIYMGGVNGLVRIDKQIKSTSLEEEEVGLINILFNGMSYLSQLNEKQKSINIPWNYTSLSIVIGLKKVDIFSRTLYRYSILGLNTDYTETYSQRIILSQLTPGSYTVMASYITHSGEWSTPSQILTVHIFPPWYKTTWFFLLVVFGIVGIAIVVIAEIIRRNRYRLILEKKEMDEEISKERIRFLVNVSHELRTPLTLIYAPLKSLLSSDKLLIDKESLKKQLNSIFNQTIQMKNIINMVLDINKPSTDYETIRKKPHSFNTWIKEVAEDFRDEFDNKQITLVYHLDENIKKVQFDENKCRIVLSNLLMNALKFSKENTSITIVAEMETLGVRVEVSDQGIGLDNIDTDLLFSRFYQGKHNEGGIGIGLSYSKTLIEKHGGTIGAMNNVDGGATFYFYLPFEKAIEIHPTPTIVVATIEEPNNAVHQSYNEAVMPKISLSGFSILIVDDNSDFRSFLEESYYGLFAEVKSAANGEEALQQIKETQPDIVVSDVMMPLMDGYELCYQIKSTLEISHIPVILLTAKSDEESVKTGYKLGADFYISKPFDPGFLKLIISNLLASREAMRAKYKELPVHFLPKEVTISSADEKFMFRLNKLIFDNLSDSHLNVDYLASELAMSRASLYNKINHLLGVGVNDYINKIKIEKAATMLTETEISIGEISMETGFRNQRYFSTVFKQFKGVSPSQYRHG